MANLADFNLDPKFVHGRLAEAVHMTGYSFERACRELKWLLEDNRWQQCGDGFEKIDDFLFTLDLFEFKNNIEQRKEFTKILTDLRATQRAIAKTFKVGIGTVNRDINPVPNGTKSIKRQINKIDRDNITVPNGTYILFQHNAKDVAKLFDEFDEKVQANIHFSSNDIEWYTPKFIIGKIIKLFGGSITLDPCSNDKDNPNVPAINHFTKEDDGLNNKWSGKVYMNPPYGREIEKWIEKICLEFEENRIQEAVALVPARTDTAWFRRLSIYPKLFIWGRLQFNESMNSAPFPSMLVYFGKNLQMFKIIFSDIGDTYVKA